MVPTQQCLGADDRAGREIHDGLKQKPELFPLQSDVQVGLEADGGHDGCAQCGLVDHGIPGLAPLGDGQRDVGLAHDVLRAL